MARYLSNDPVVCLYTSLNDIQSPGSKLRQTSRKLTPFVAANGVTVAEQSFDYSQNEQLSFIHQDASGVSVRETSETGGRPVYTPEEAEFDALGNNVGLYNPYATIISEPPPDDNGGGVIGWNDSAYGGGSSSSPFSRRYYSDGLAITEA